MSRIQIYYFSGTGNTFLVINRLGEALKELGHDIKLTSCEKAENIDMNCYIVGIAFPIHTSSAPKIFTDFIEKIPKVKSMPLFGIVTSGYMAGDVLAYESKQLIKKGYEPFLFRNIIVANNLHVPLLCPLKITGQITLDKRLKRIDITIKKIAINISNKSKDKRGNNPIGKIYGVAQRSIGTIHEKINFRGFSCIESCTRCKWCLNNCPTKNIYLEKEEIKFGLNCILCMRCYNFCPFNAIQVTSKTLNKLKYKRYKGPEGLGNKTPFNQ